MFVQHVACDGIRGYMTNVAGQLDWLDRSDGSQSSLDNRCVCLLCVGGIYHSALWSDGGVCVHICCMEVMMRQC